MCGVIWGQGLYMWIYSATNKIVWVCANQLQWAITFTLKKNPKSIPPSLGLKTGGCWILNSGKGELLWVNFHYLLNYYYFLKSYFNSKYLSVLCNKSHMISSCYRALCGKLCQWIYHSYIYTFTPVEVKGTILLSPSLFAEPQGVGFSIVEQSSEPDCFLWV